MWDDITARIQINSIEDMYHPIIVIGCATANESRRAMFIRSERFDIIAAARETALITMTLSDCVSISIYNLSTSQDCLHK